MLIAMEKPEKELTFQLRESISVLSTQQAPGIYSWGEQDNLMKHCMYHIGKKNYL
jgi:hypothetical protein